MEEIKSNRKRLKNKPSIFSLFIDLKSAFDKVNHEILISKLGDLGFDKKLIQTIKLIYSNTKASVGEQSPFDIELGVLQGSLISHILFNLFINDLFKESCSLCLNLYAYDDDIVFLVEGE
jgi:RNA-directed DNA polymerase